MGLNTDREVPVTTTNATGARAQGGPSPTSSGTPTGQAKPVLLRRAGSVVVRLFLIGGVLWLGWITLASFAELFSGPQPLRYLEPPSPSPERLPSLPEALQAL